MAKPNRITEWIKRRGTTLEGLHELTGLSIAYLSRMANGKREVSLKNLKKIANALRVNQGDLIEDPDVHSKLSARERRIIAATLELIHLRIKMLLQISSKDLEGTIEEAIAQPLSEGQRQLPSSKGLAARTAAPKESKKSPPRKLT